MTLDLPPFEHIGPLAKRMKWLEAVTGWPVRAQNLSYGQIWEACQRATINQVQNGQRRSHEPDNRPRTSRPRPRAT
jgi:hypothetical protein